MSCTDEVLGKGRVPGLEPGAERVPPLGRVPGLGPDAPVGAAAAFRAVNATPPRPDWRVKYPRLTSARGKPQAVAGVNVSALLPAVRAWPALAGIIYCRRRSRCPRVS